MRGLPSLKDSRLLSGWDNGEDAALWSLGDGRLAILTIDFITPIVDDPVLFGEIAAANALSDVFAMGGLPRVALNVVGFPTSCEPLEVLEGILLGGAKKVAEAGACLAGGHSVQDDEPKYGLSVYGEVTEDRLWRVTGARPGDGLILTKPLGSGILTTAFKAKLAGQAMMDEAIRWMRKLNDIPRSLPGELLSEINAATDVTGFGFVGHCLDMVSQGLLDAEIDHRKVPAMMGVVEMASMGMVPAGAYANREHFQQRATVEPSVPLEVQDIFFDPQTSGGLLLAVSMDAHEALLRELRKSGFTDSSLVGRFVEGAGRVRVY